MYICNGGNKRNTIRFRNSTNNYCVALVYVYFTSILIYTYIFHSFTLFTHSHSQRLAHIRTHRHRHTLICSFRLSQTHETRLQSPKSPFIYSIPSRITSIFLLNLSFVFALSLSLPISSFIRVFILLFLPFLLSLNLFFFLLSLLFLFCCVFGFFFSQFVEFHLKNVHF